VARSAEGIVAKAIGRVLSRHAMAVAAEHPLSFEQFRHEVQAEVGRLLEKRAERDLRRLRSAALMVSALSSVPSPEAALPHGWVDLDASKVALVLQAAGVPRPGQDPEFN
jgi:hypothetical protein